MGTLPEAFFFADTGAEPEEVYDHIQVISKMAGNTPIILCKKDGRPDAWEDQAFEDECDGMCGL